MEPIRKHTDVAILGAGLVGSALALALAKRGLQSVVIERQERVPEQLRGETIMPAGVDVLDRLGLGPALRKVCVETHGIVLHHPAFSGGSYCIDYGAAGPPADARPVWLPRGLAGWRRPLYEVLRRALREHPDVELLEGYRVASARRTNDGAHALALEGPGARTLVARLVVGADGRSSQARKLFGFEPMEDVQSNLVQGFVGWGRAHELRQVHVGVHELGAAFVIPFPDGYFRSTFEFENAHLDALRGGDPLKLHLELVRAALPEMYAELGAEAIKPVTRLQMHPGHTTLLAGIVEDGVALVGDAAGCIDPFTGFGMSIGLDDAECLAQVVAKSGGDYSARVLREYERRRQPRIALRRVATDEVAYMFLNKSEPFAYAYIERLARRWEAAPFFRPLIALQFAGYDLPLVPSVGLKHHVFGLL